ncbi:MAG: hypothetical protein HDR80_00500 [Bacteroides sp.]|nr:hypothetical protein [Bacteroides sp.]
MSEAVRTGAVYLLAILGLLLFFAIPEETSEHWMRDILVTKGAAFACMAAAMWLGRIK